MSASPRSFSSVVEADIERLLADTRDSLAAAAGSTVLVTGAAGFLMSYLIDLLAAWNRAGLGQPIRILALDNFSTGLPDRLAHLAGETNFELIDGNVAQPLACPTPVDWIVHGASIASPAVYRQFPLETLDANIAGTRNLLELSRVNPVRGFLLLSTSEIYGDPDPAFIPTEESYRGFVSCTGPRACYDEGKRVAETLAMTFFRLFETPVKLARPFNVYGPGLRLDDRRVLPDFMTRVLADEAIVLLSDGRPTRAFCYVSDAVALLARILFSSAAGEAFNVGNDEREVSMLDLARLTAEAGAAALARPAVSVRAEASSDVDYLTDNPQRRLASLAKARTWFPDWSPRAPLEEGLVRTFRHHIEKGGARFAPGATSPG